MLLDSVVLTRAGSVFGVHCWCYSHTLVQRSSEWVLTSAVDIAWELVRNAHSQVCPDLLAQHWEGGGPESESQQALQ